MAKLVKELAELCYQVDKLYYHEEFKDKRKEIRERFDNLSQLLEKAIRSQFDENDKEYEKTIRKIRENIAEIKKLKDGLIKLTNLFSTLSELIENIDSLLTVILKKNAIF